MTGLMGYDGTYFGGELSGPTNLICCCPRSNSLAESWMRASRLTKFQVRPPLSAIERTERCRNNRRHTK